MKPICVSHGTQWYARYTRKIVIISLFFCLQCAAVCCSAFSVCCSVLQCVAVVFKEHRDYYHIVLVIVGTSEMEKKTRQERFAIVGRDSLAITCVPLCKRDSFICVT